MCVIGRYGFERVRAVLAHQIQKHEYDGRYAVANKVWVKGFVLPDKAYTFTNSHATLIDGFATYVRKLYADMGAERFALPGQEEYGEFIHGYEVQRAIQVDDNQGYTVAHNPDAASSWVCWQFYMRDGERDYNWGIYGNEQTAIDAYKARLFVALITEGDIQHEP